MPETPPPTIERALTAPPAGTALLDAVQTMRPVRPRAPGRVLLTVLVVGLVGPVALVLAKSLRVDLPFLPAGWVVAMAIVWAAGVLVPLGAAILPRRGEVLADTARAGRVAVTCAALLLLLGLFATIDAPGHTTMPRSFAQAWWHCAAVGLEITTPVLLVSALALRRHHPFGSARVAAALGAAGGALGGLTLHFICSLGGGLHVGLAHAGGVVLGALLGTLLLPPIVRS